MVQVLKFDKKVILRNIMINNGKTEIKLFKLKTKRRNLHISVVLLGSALLN